MRKAILEARLAKLEEKKKALIERSDKSDDIAEVRSISERLREIAEDIDDIRSEMSALDADAKAGNS